MSEMVLIVGGGLLQVPAVRIAHEQGFRVAVTDRDPNAVCFAEADERYVLDTKDVDGHVELARRLRSEGRLAGVFTEGADVEVTVAEAAHAAALPGVSTRAARICNDKAEFRRVYASHGLPGPAFEEVASAAEAERAARSIGFPVILKALDNSGSRGATKVASGSGIDAAFAEALRHSGSGTVLVEEVMAGPEQSVETLVADGVHHRLNVVDRPFAFDPYPIELGHDNPSALDDEQQEALFELVEESARAVGIELGAAKADTMLTTSGPVVLEMTARLSGGFHCQYTSPLAHGTNEIKAALDLAVGRPLDPADLRPTHRRHSICRALFPEPGMITRIDGVERALEIPGVEHVLFRFGVGDTVPEYRHCADRVGFVITCANDRREALAAADRAAAAIQVETSQPSLASS